MQCFAVNYDALRSLLCPVAITTSSSLECLWLCVLLPCSEKQGKKTPAHSHTHQCIISHTTKLPLANGSHTSPPVETALFDEAGEIGKNSKQREGGGIIIPGPPGG